MKRYTINVHYDAVVSVEVIAETEQKAFELALDKANDVSLEDADIVGTNLCVASMEELVMVMDTTNAHNKELVEKINYAYNTRKEDFLKIARLLAQRDEEECNENNIDPNNEITFDNCINEYLMRVADDQDLETIISFLRIS